MLVGARLLKTVGLLMQARLLEAVVLLAIGHGRPATLLPVHVSDAGRSVVRAQQTIAKQIQGQLLPGGRLGRLGCSHRLWTPHSLLLTLLLSLLSSLKLLSPLRLLSSLKLLLCLLLWHRWVAGPIKSRPSHIWLLLLRLLLLWLLLLLWALLCLWWQLVVISQHRGRCSRAAIVKG